MHAYVASLAQGRAYRFGHNIFAGCLVCTFLFASYVTKRCETAVGVGLESLSCPSPGLERRFVRMVLEAFPAHPPRQCHIALAVWL